MALIECSVCRKRMSSKASSCPHCQAKTDGDNESLSRISHIQKSSSLMNQSFVAMTLFIAGVVIWFWGGEPAEGMRANIAGICFVFGFVGYLITRVRIVLHKRKSV
ncbi:MULTISPECIES: zinc ribbon domain-containing protein [unclassified Shewanella]|uniref:zinc ribbon domain-containing protein n=1 Tax=Shewanella TaxID=22 RepID=UPI0021D85FBE|nr:MULTISPECIES: zinc ribbon domain-containing protein [unclassified Shewanella]MCU7998481.1 zinc ribbon domain-containing protein [Shewanella sp. SM95]MCU8103594.1 zinc ribbon domain-containing protein [Shewanella sp. SM101]